MATDNRPEPEGLASLDSAQDRIVVSACSLCVSIWPVQVLSPTGERLGKRRRQRCARQLCVHLRQFYGGNPSHLPTKLAQLPGGLMNLSSGDHRKYVLNDKPLGTGF